MRYREYSFFTFLLFYLYTFSPFLLFYLSTFSPFQITTAVPLHVTISIEPPCPIVS